MHTLINDLKAIHTQWELTKAINEAKLSASEWKALCRQVLGYGGRSGKDAREMLHLHYSDALLVAERVEQVKKSFAA
jgi:hypothetical protein